VNLVLCDLQLMMHKYMLLGGSLRGAGGRPRLTTILCCATIQYMCSLFVKERGSHACRQQCLRESCGLLFPTVGQSVVSYAVAAAPASHLCTLSHTANTPGLTAHRALAPSGLQPLRRSCATRSRPSCWQAMRPVQPCSCGLSTSWAGTHRRGSR
jgi:hypothetical protein